MTNLPGAWGYGPSSAICATVLVFALGEAPACAAQHLEGTTGESALYALDLPDAWNGDLIVYAHGIVNPDLPLAAPTAQDGFHLFRDALLGLGYAVASSSYSENGYALKDGAQRTHQLAGLFTSKFGRPRRIFLAGHSLGGVIAQMLAEQHAAAYDGALLMCAFLGGGPAEVHYLGNGRVLFDYFFPGVVPGDAFHVPDGLDFFQGSPTFLSVLGALSAGLVLPGQPTLQYARVARLPGTTPEEIVVSALNVVGFNIRFGNDIIDRTRGHVFFDNSATRYEGSLDDEGLNRDVQRFTATPDAEHYFEKYYTPTGVLSFPVLTLHTAGDPVVPLFHEAAYRGLVASAGASGLLVQRTIHRPGHCAFTPEETLEALLDLAAWVETGVAPPEGGEPLP